jgi:hypothetical protein
MNMKVNKTEISNAFAALIVATVALVISPLLVYVSGWCFGWFANLFFGNWLAHAINGLFVTSLSASVITQCAGLLAMIGHPFKGGSDVDLSLNSSSDEDEDEE